MRYYVRRRSDGAIAGPYGLNELGARRGAGEFEDHDELLEARGQSLRALRGSDEWEPLGGLVRLPGGPPLAPPAPGQVSAELGYLRDVRERSSYRPLRGLLTALLVLSLFANGAVTFAGMAQSDAGSGFLVLLAGVVGAVSVVALYLVLQLLVDVADVQVQRGAHAAPVRDAEA